MELSVSVCLVLTLSLVTASPYGYGAKSGAVAKAEASTGAGSFDFPHLSPLTVQGNSGFSGSFSKSSSSSFASASASSSSSSFSYSGAGAGQVPGFGTKLGCGGGCQNGINNDFGPSGHGTNNNGGFGGHNFAGASATAGAANFPIAVDQRCHGSNCFVTSDKKCTSSQCKGLSTNANGNVVESTGNSASESNGDESNDFSVSQPHLTDVNHNKVNNGNEKLDINSGLKQTLPVVPFDKKVNNENDNVANCEGPACGTFLPLTPHESNDNNLNKKSETSYQEQACATHDCNLAGSTNQRKPSSYNVPILGPQAKIEKENPICTSDNNCQDANYVENHDEKTLQTSNVNKPSTTIQLPAGPSDEVTLCKSKDCHNPSYQQTQDQQLSGPNKLVNPSTASGPSYTPNILTGSDNQPNFGLNHSYYPNIPSGINDNPRGPQRFDNKPPPQTTVAQGSLNNNNLHHPSVSSATHPSVSAVNDKKPNYEPVPTNQNPITKPTGPFIDTSSLRHSASGINPSGPSSSGESSVPTGGASSYGTSHNNCISGNCAYPSSPSYSEVNGPTGSDSDLICAFDNCASSPQSAHPISNKPLNININSNIQPPHYPHQNPSSNQFGCTTQNCHPSFGYETSPKIKPTFSKSSIMEKLNPSNTDSEVLLSNKGNNIYSGAFNSPVGILSANNNGKPSSGIFINPDSGAKHNTPHITVSSPQLPLGPDSIQSVPSYSHPISTPGQQSVNMNDLNKPSPLVPIVISIKPEENKRPYTGGFGGPAGLLKPNDYMIPPNIPKVGCSSGNCNPSQGTQNGLSGALAASYAGANAAAATNANAASFSGTFGGPPGLLKPYDEGKLDQTGKNVLGKHGNDFGNSGMSQIQPHSNGVGHTNAVASASTVAGSYGQSGGCNTGCPSNESSQDQSGALGHSSGVQDGLNHASATASAKSVASSYAHGRSIATASAHVSAGASAKGGAWR